MSAVRGWKAAAWTPTPGCKPTDVQRSSFRDAHAANVWARKHRVTGRTVAVWFVDQLPPAELEGGVSKQPAPDPARDPQRGRKLQVEGMARAEANTRASWAQTCDAAIDRLAATGRPFQAVDLTSEGVPEPDHPNQWGPRLAAAALRGVIVHAGYAQSTRATVRRSATRVWRGSSAVQQQDSA